MAGLLDVVDESTRTCALPPEHARVLCAEDDPAHVAPFAHMMAGIGGVLPRVAEAYRTGAGVPYEAYGGEFRHGQGHINRPAFTADLPGEWLEAMPDVAARLRARPGARVADIGCGQGWSAIAVAQAFPHVHVEGIDADPRSLMDARAHAVAAGVDGRVRFVEGDAAALGGGPYELVLILETLHDLPRPVEALRAARAATVTGGAVLVADERVADAFAAPGDEVERMMYGWSVTPIENIEGSPFNDAITGSDLDKVERFTGGAGNDTIAGLGGTDLFDEGATRSGSDTYNGGAGPDVITGNAGANVINGHGGSDFIIGSGGDDRLIGGAAFDQLFGDAGNDVIEAQDNAPDRVRCGGDADTVNADLADADTTGCEVVSLVGTLGLTPKALRAEAGEALRLKLSWTHPEDWKKLRRVALRLRSGDDVVGRVVIEPGAERMSAGGAVRLLKASRLSHRAGAVTARLSLELAPRLAGRTLEADVAASDVDGRSRLERGAATIRVARGR